MSGICEGDYQYILWGCKSIFEYDIHKSVLLQYIPKMQPIRCYVPQFI
jgi:hypothetical protein